MTSRGQLLLEACASQVSKLMRYCIVKILETDNLQLVEEEKLKGNGDTELYLVQYDRKDCHAILVHTGGKEECNKILNNLVKYEKIHKKYGNLNSKSVHVQTTSLTDSREVGVQTCSWAMQSQRSLLATTAVEMGLQTDSGHMDLQSIPIVTPLESGLQTGTRETEVQYLSLTIPSGIRHATPVISPGTSVFDDGNSDLDGNAREYPELENLCTQDNQKTYEYTDMTPVDFGMLPAFTPSIQAAVQLSGYDKFRNEPSTSTAFPREVPSNLFSEVNQPPEAQTSGYTEKRLPSSVSTKQSTKRRKEHFCKFCKKLFSNFSRHLISNHAFEEQVASFAAATTKSEKLFLLRKIMAEGDSYFNEQNPNSPIVRRRAIGSQSSQWDKCPVCKMYISKNHAVKHYRQCNPDSELASGKSIRVRLNRETLQLQESLSEDMKTRIIPFMRNDSIRQLCESDPSLIMYGNKQCSRLKGEGQEKTIRNHLRIVGRVAEKTLQIRKQIDGSVASVVETFEPACYDSFVSAINEICGYGLAEGEEMRNPTTPHQYGPRMRELSDYIMTELLKKVDPVTLENEPVQNELQKKIDLIRAWQGIYDRDFDKQVASLGRKQADRRTYELKQITPSMEDVQKLIDYVQKRTAHSFEILQRGFTFQAYKTLNECLLLRLWIFNRRRVGEVDKLRLQNWLKAKEVDESSDQYKALSRTEQTCASSFKRLSVQGKLRRPVALLVPKKDLACFDLIISLRSQAKVQEDNVYLFALQDRYMEGTAVMSDYAKASGAKHWNLLTGTRLRKQLAASLRYLNLTDEDLRLVAEALGHTEKTHMLSYRKHDPALHAGRISKLLMAIDDGSIAKFKGKSLEEMDDTVTMEAVPLSEVLVDVDVDDDLDQPEHLQNMSTKTEEPDKVSLSPPSHSLQQAGEEIAPVKARKKKSHDFDSDDSSQNEEPPKRVRGNTPGRKRAFATRKTHKKLRWSNKLKIALKQRFEKEMEHRKCPSTTQVLKAIEVLEDEFPEIVNHSPKKVKALVSNLFGKK